MNPFALLGPGEIAWRNLRYVDKRGAGIAEVCQAEGVPGGHFFRCITLDVIGDIVCSYLYHKL